MSNPILALTPSGYKAEKVYSVLPSDGSGDFTFDRANGLATRINKDGLIEEVANDTPRFNYLNSTCPSLLLESESTNRQIRSEEFENSAWGKANVFVTSNLTTSPSGELNADKIIATNTTSVKTIQEVMSGAATTSGATVSIFVKKAEITQIRIVAATNISPYTNWARVSFDLETLQEFGSTLGTFKFEDYGGGWYRLSITGTPLNTSNVYQFSLVKNQNVTFTGNNSDGLFLWGAQVEQKSDSSSYIPTQNTAITRFVDICKDAGNAALFNVSELSLFFDVNNFKPDTGSFSYIVLTDGQSSPINMIRFDYKQDRIVISNYVNGTLGLYYTITSVVPNQRNKMALTISTARTKVYFNGVLKSTTAGDNIPSGLNSLSFTNRTKSGGYFEGEVQDARVYNRVLTETEAIKLTT